MGPKCCHNIIDYVGINERTISSYPNDRIHGIPLSCQIESIQNVALAASEARDVVLRAIRREHVIRFSIRSDDDYLVNRPRSSNARHYLRHHR